MPSTERTRINQLMARSVSNSIAVAVLTKILQFGWVTSAGSDPSVYN